MSQSLTEFLSNIDSLIKHLKYEKNTQIYLRKGVKKYSGNSSFEIEFRELVSNLVETSFLQSRVYSYQNAIISLYGYLERFIENIIIEYLKTITSVCPEFYSLPKSIIKNHLNLSLDLISKIQKTKIWPNEIRKYKLGKAVENMNTFLQECNTYNINHEAFTNHSSNFRYDSIHDIFNKIGIEQVSKQCFERTNFKKSISEKNNIEGVTDNKILTSLLVTELEDLVQRRNEIAHGARIDNIESIDILFSKINIIREYVKAIDYIVMSSLDNYKFTVSDKICLGKASKVFTDINVIGYEKIELIENKNINKKISEGDLLVATSINNNDENESGEILSLVRDGIQEKEILLPCDKPITIKVNFNISQKTGKKLIYIMSR